MSEYEGSIRSFESLRSSPQAENFCVEVRIWGVNCFLAAYRHDCSIRLFDSVEGSESSGERLCRELICHRIDPYKKTKKRKSQLVAMALDRDFIGCLLHMVDDTSEEDNHILTVLSRDSFLMDDDSNSDVAQVIDIRQSVLNFLLSCDDVDHGLLQLHDFLSNDGDLDDIDVVVSQSLVECGYGRFIVEVANCCSLKRFDGRSRQRTDLAIQKAVLVFNEHRSHNLDVGFRSIINPFGIPQRRNDVILYL